jgi:hypothetical protein
VVADVVDDDAHVAHVFVVWDATSTATIVLVVACLVVGAPSVVNVDAAIAIVDVVAIVVTIAIIVVDYVGVAIDV